MMPGAWFVPLRTVCGRNFKITISPPTAERTYKTGVRYKFFGIIIRFCTCKRLFKNKTLKKVH